MYFSAIFKQQKQFLKSNLKYHVYNDTEILTVLNSLPLAQAHFHTSHPQHTHKTVKNIEP